MKVSELWLREWVNPSLTAPQLAAQLTMAGLEVDGLYPVAGVFDHVVVAKVLDTKPLRPGLWKVRVQWTVGGEDYYLDQIVVIAPHS